MRLWTVFTLFLFFCLIPLSLQQDYDDTQLTAGESWRTGDTDKIVERKDEEVSEDEEMTKRIRSRNGNKRRRRRKRPRPTELPIEEVSDSEHVPEEQYGINLRKVSEEETTPEPEELPKRRTPKRRRRPHRRFPDPEYIYEREQEEAPKPPRRRRKGGRKRLKPVEVEEFPETTTLPEIPQYVSETNVLLHRENNMKEITTIPTITTSTSRRTSTTTTTTTTPTTAKSYEDVSENAVLKHYYEEEKDEHITIKNTSPQRSRQYIVKNNIKLSTDKIEQNDDKVFGNKIFDRRTLFSKSRRLPETSAILRKRVVPQKTEAETFNLHIINPLANLESNLYNKNASRNEIVSKVNIPIGISKLPESISPKSIIDKIKHRIIASSTEEPNYPKFEFERVNLEKHIYSQKSSRHTTEPSVQKQDVIKVFKKQETTTIVQTTLNEDKYVEETTIYTTESPSTNARLFDPSDKIDDTLNATNLNDSLLDLLKTESTRISKILELRNMTLDQLLEHRERGSSKFILSDMFDSKKANPEKNEELTSTTERDNKTEQIQFPEEEILGSFPKFLSDQIHKHTQHQKKEKSDENETGHTEHREPRVFESMPKFSTKLETPDKLNPTWRIIPNPRLKPVSIHGNFEEIKITDIIPENSNEIKEIYLLEDNDIAQGTKISDSFNTETVKSYNSINTFKQIPFSIKSAIIISGAILALAIFGFMSVLISCRVRQKKARIRAKQDILREHLKNEDFMTSQQSLSPVLNKHQRGPVFSQGIHSNTTSNRHYYLWRTLRKTFQYD
ncbi:uncharacterized protein LOC106670181 [Cimex lectularius]|uniref:Uncharacterized protein n=1 Tax=Cimex lectularius TaxID=79782 RepID=A0A8I6TM94_CIMLE|nr:uncharacterized protein LOC106670181 [Cimex lectularius]